MSDQPTTSGLEAYVRGNVTQNSRGFTREHTISARGQISVEMMESGRLFLRIKTDDGHAFPLSFVLDALHQEADAANQREIDRQREQQLAAVRAE